jgi:hypothetical protein
MSRKIDYNSRNFNDVRTELINFVQQYYPDIYSDFNDASVGMMLLELNAAVGDMLSFHTDRMFNETQLNYMQERSSVLEMGRTYGLKIPNKRPSITIVDWSVVVPPLGDTFDESYAPIIFKGSQATGAGKVFELIDDSDFSSPFSSSGVPNRLIIPNIDSNGQIQNYTLVKRELVINGTTKIFKRVITTEDYKPFFKVLLPEEDVLSIESVILKEGTNFTENPTDTEFNDFDIRWFEVDALAESEIFIEDENNEPTDTNIKSGRWVNVTRRFEKDFTDNGFCELTFGAGVTDVSSFSDFIGCRGQLDQIGNLVNNDSLGEIPNTNHTMFVQYRIGGGTTSNVGNNVITSLGFVSMNVNGDITSINQSVRNSLTVNNPIPAVGGKNQPSIEEIRNLIRYNFSSQNRAVTLKDYKALLGKMPGKFGVPYRCGVTENRNKVDVSILTLDSDSKLNNTSNSVLKENIAEYLADYRMLNDFCTIKDGRIINLAFEVDLFVDKTVQRSEIISNVVESIQTYMDIDKWDMGMDIYLSQLIENINNVGGVLNVIDLKVFNKVGEGKYSVNEITQPYVIGEEDKRQIEISNEYTLFGEQSSMYEIKFPDKDIKVRVK